METMQRISLTNLLAQLTMMVASCSAATLFAADSRGNVTTLSLTIGTGNDSSLVASHRTTDCATNPSWLTLDTPNRILYCIDRATNSVVNGSLNSFSVGPDGALAHIDRIPIASSGVAGEIVTLDSGVRAYVTAS
jgi:6-phosphogluconolactonase (cycloisomerase 2 family)